MAYYDASPSQDPYSAANSRQRLNGPGVDAVQANDGGLRRSASHWSPTTPVATYPSEKTDFKAWRRDFHDTNLWTRGGGIRTAGRFCCCTLFIAVFLIISIVLTIAVYIRPPDVTFDGVALDTAKGALDASTPGSFTINLKVSLTVRNPNFFSATFDSITVKAFYPLQGTQRDVGGGQKTHVVFGSDATSHIDFPLAITYNQTQDQNLALITDIANKCGLVTGSPPGNLPVRYDLTLKIRILVATISPSFNGNADFPCPADQLKVLAGSLLPGLGGS